MSQLSASQIKTLIDFFRSDNNQLISSGKLKDYLLEYFNDGYFHYNGKTFHFIQGKKYQLRKELEAIYPKINWLKPIPRGLNRTQITQYTPDDKQADIKPNDQFLTLKSLDGHYQNIGLDIQLPLMSSLRLHINDISLINVRWLLIVENQDSHDLIYQYPLPANLDACVVIYKGNSKNALTLLLDTLPAHIQVCLFPDLDPKGLESAFTLCRINYLLLPDIQKYSQQLVSSSHTNTFLRQQNACIFLHKQQYWLTPIRFVLDNKLAVTQQTMLQQQLSLTLYSKQN